VDEKEYPRDFATFARYHLAVRNIPECYPMPEPLGLARLASFLEQAEIAYPVRWLGEMPAGAG
jgi:hypothetical protein